EATQRALRVDVAEIRRAAGRETLIHDGAALPVASLAALLGLPSRDGETAGKRPCLVVEAAGERGGLVVDELLGEREVFVKGLQPPLRRVRHVSGGGLLGSGELALILRPADLLRSLLKGLPAAPVAAAPEPAAPATILV